MANGTIHINVQGQPMKLLYLPLAITLVVLLLMVYVTAALGSAVIGAPLAWLRRN